jgi:hypothetical protein
MKNISTGFGLCVLGLGIAAWPVLDRLMPTANASAVTAAAAAVSTAATGQTTPTIVWYSTINNGWEYCSLWRAWSDGRVEVRRVRLNNAVDPSWCGPNPDYPCKSPWYVISDPAQGLTYRSDINFDEKVDGADLGQLLADWGNAPRQDIPPSDCPLALINP